MRNERLFADGNRRADSLEHQRALPVCSGLIASYFGTSDAGMLARSQYSEGPTTGHLDTGFPGFPSVYKQTLRRFPTFQVAITCFSCNPPD